MILPTVRSVLAGLLFPLSIYQGIREISELKKMTLPGKGLKSVNIRCMPLFKVRRTKQ